MGILPWRPCHLVEEMETHSTHTLKTQTKFRQLQNSTLESTNLLKKQVIMLYGVNQRKLSFFIFPLIWKEKKLIDEPLKFQLGNSLFET